LEPVKKKDVNPYEWLNLKNKYIINIKIKYIDI
jgi:hypothetical protein